MMLGLVVVMLLESWSGSFSPANLPLQARTTKASVMYPTTVVRKKHVCMEESGDVADTSKPEDVADTSKPEDVADTSKPDDVAVPSKLVNPFELLVTHTHTHTYTHTHSWAPSGQWGWTQSQRGQWDRVVGVAVECCVAARPPCGGTLTLALTLALLTVGHHGGGD
jgi:hypothetical protein